MRYPCPVLAAACLIFALAPLRAEPAFADPKPDLTVAADGNGDFKTIQAALASIPRDNHQRVVIFVKDGVYPEKVRIDPSDITLRGQSQAGTRIEFAQGASEFRAKPDDLGSAVVNINGNDCVLQNLTIQNTHGVIGVHAFAIFGKGDRTVITDCNVWSQGNDTLSLWRTGDAKTTTSADTSPEGRYYHARLNVRGSVDFVCPRGWCYMTDCTLYEVNPRAEAAIWHDGSRNRDMKFVLRNCRLDGVEGWHFARHHHDAQFFLLDCSFSQAMADRPPKRVMYPLNGGAATDEDKRKNAAADPSNVWGERFYYFNCHRAGGDFSWFKDNLSTAGTTPKPEQITAAWTFGGTWDPENQAGPSVKKISSQDARYAVTFSENVTVKGKPRLILRSGAAADYVAGSGSDTLIFAATGPATGPVERIDLQVGAIVATEAAATLRRAAFSLPSL